MKLTAFAGLLAVAFGAAFGLGAVVDPTDGAPRSAGHAAMAGGATSSSPADEHGGADDGHGAAGGREAAGAHAPTGHEATGDGAAESSDPGESDHEAAGEGSSTGDHAASSDHADAAPAGLSAVQDGYRLVPELTRVAVGRTASFRFRIEGPDGRAVRSGYELESERELHLIVVRRDGAGFQHLHPRRAADGTWSTDLTLGEAGTHRVLADFVVGGTRRTLGVDVESAGSYRPVPTAAASTSVDVDGYRVVLTGPPATAGRTSALRFRVTRGGRPVTALQPYLGARGHLVALRDGDLAYLHVHPDPDPEAGEIPFAATFPSAGRYRLFLQFRADGVVRTAPLVAEVAR
ncbi:hypothetical protein AB0L40_04870 [Patulibacter sp. NPDC049589]|uniref:hypothetical protein n=1 Tax=Patulibacter sp. NPDC049589 TaxID=3154731 RepID=UPI00344A3F80